MLTRIFHISLLVTMKFGIGDAQVPPFRIFAFNEDLCSESKYFT